MQQIYGFKSQSDLDRIAKAVRRVEQADIRGQQNSRYENSHNTIHAKLTAVDSTNKKFSFAQARPKLDGTWETITDGITGDKTKTDGFAIGLNGHPTNSVNDYVTLVRSARNDGSNLWSIVWIIISGGGCLFPVKVTVTPGGTNGTKTTAANYTYTVKTLDGATTLGTSIAQTKPRPNGTMTAGSSYGVAFYDGTTLILWDAGEIYGIGGC